MPTETTLDPASTEAMIEKILQRLERMAPGNAAPIPFTTALEEGVWHVDVMVRTETHEWDIHTEAPTLKRALRRAYNGMANSSRQAASLLN